MMAVPHSKGCRRPTKQRCAHIQNYGCPMSAAMPTAVGVCVTGEARSFRFAGVRESLRQFLRDSSAVEIRMRIARSTIACTGFENFRSSRLCTSSKESPLTLSHSEIQREFPEAHIELLNASTCAGMGETEACCKSCCKGKPEQSCSAVHAFLQYAAVASCATQLLERRSLTHIVRTRPDMLYLGRIEFSRIDSITMIRKAEAGSVQSQRTDGREAAHAGDWFFVAPVHSDERRELARRFFDSLVKPMREHCARGSCGLAMSNTPELDWTAHGFASRHNIVVATFPLLLVYASSIPQCQRVSAPNCSLQTALAMFGSEEANDPWVAPPSVCKSPCESIDGRLAKQSARFYQAGKWRGKTLRIRGPRQKMGEAGFFVYALWVLNAIDWAVKRNLSYCVYLDGQNNPYFSHTRHPRGEGSANLWTDFFLQPGTRRCLALPEVMQMELSESDWRHGAQAGGWSVYRHEGALKAFPNGLCNATCKSGSYAWYRSMRWRGAALVELHLKPQAEVRQRADAIWEKSDLKGRRVLGAHLRGTDKVWGTKVPPSRYLPYFETWLRHYGDDARVLVATEDSNWLSEIRAWCRTHSSWCGHKQLVWTGAARGAHGSNIFLDTTIGDPYEKGLDVLVDVQLLSRVDFLLKSTTNVGEFVLYFNASLIARSFDFEIRDHPDPRVLGFPALDTVNSRQDQVESSSESLPVPDSWLLEKSIIPNAACTSTQGVLRVRGADAGAGFGTLFFLYPINQLLLADAHCLLPLFSYIQERSPNYFDPSHGTNPWEYFFEPIGDKNAALEHANKHLPVYELTPGTTSVRGEKGGQYLAMHNGAPWAVRAYDHQSGWAHRNHSHFDESWYARNREMAGAVIAKHIRVRRNIAEEADRLWQSCFSQEEHPILGLHIRGGDKSGPWRHPIDPVEAYLPYVSAFLRANPRGKVMLATDDAKLAAGVLHGDWPPLVRSAVIMPQPITKDRNLRGGMRPKPCLLDAPCGKYEQGLTVLLDILLLAKCDYLVHGESAVSEAALYLQPSLRTKSVPISFLNRPLPEEEVFKA